MKKNKAAWIRIIESTVSILLVLSVFIIFYNTQRVVLSSPIENQIYPLLDEIARNESLREDILNQSLGAEAELRSLIDKNINKYAFNYSILICSATDACSQNLSSLPKRGSIYSFERIISVNLTMQNAVYPNNSKKIKIFIWNI